MESIYFILNKCLHYFLAIQVLNLSFNNLASEDRATGIENNEINSAIEYVTEHLLGWKDFVPEQHKAHQDKHYKASTACSLFCEHTAPTGSGYNANTQPLNIFFIVEPLRDYDQEINPPPPR